MGSLRVLSFGRARMNDMYATAIEQGTKGTSYSVAGVVVGPYEIPVLGHHNVMNALAAMLVAKRTASGSSKD